MRDSRKIARKNAFFLLFQMDFNDTSEYEKVKSIFFANSEEGLSDVEKTYVEDVTLGTKNNFGEINDIIAKFSKDGNIGRMFKVDLAILRLAVFEIKFFKETPVAVAINEAVELAKEFSSDEAPVFINGILGKVASSLESGELNG